jgi:glutathione S-transferase
MEPNESISERLLSRLPQPANLATYQEEVTSLLAENERRLRRNKWTVVRVWIFVVVVSAPFLWKAGAHFNTAEGNWFLGLVGFWVLFGAIELAKYQHNQDRVELLKELKQVQLQILGLHALLKGGTAMSEKSQ